MFPTVQPRPFFATRATGHAGRAVCCIVFPCGWETVACGSDNAPSRHSASRWTRLCPDMSSPVVDIVSNAEARTRYGLYPHQAGKGRRSPRCSTLYRMKQGPGASFLPWVSRLFEGEYRLPLVQRTSASPWHRPDTERKWRQALRAPAAGESICPCREADYGGQGSSAAVACWLLFLTSRNSTPYSPQDAATASSVGRHVRHDFPEVFWLRAPLGYRAQQHIFSLFHTKPAICVAHPQF